MSRWYDKLTGLRKGSHWKRYADTRGQVRVIRPKPAPLVLSDLQVRAKSMINLRIRGIELVGPCPKCAGKLIVGPLRWQCLGCGSQEIEGSDLAGFVRAYDAAPR